jgi:hypothetical protein
LLLLGHGDLTFEDAGASLPARHAWSSMMADFDRDGVLDLFVAAETWPFSPEEVYSSLYYGGAVDARGHPRLAETPFAATLRSDAASTSMGIAANVPGDGGDLELVLTEQGPSVYIAQSGGAPSRELELRSFTSQIDFGEATHTSWGVALEDFDRDGHVDALMAAGAPCVPEMCARYGMPVTQESRLLHYAGDRLRYESEEAVPRAGGLAPPLDKGAFRGERGVVLADLDGDGHPEIVVTPFRDRFRVFRDVAPGGDFLRVRLRGTVSAPDPYGAEVTVSANGRRATRQLTSGGSTHSQSEPALSFELGAGARAATVTVRWPSGLQQTLDAVATDRNLDITEPRIVEIPSRFATAGAGPIEIFLQRVGPDGEPSGPDLPGGLAVRASDGVAFTIEPLGGGRFRASRPAPTTPGPIRIEIEMDGLVVRTHPILRFR